MKKLMLMVAALLLLTRVASAEPVKWIDLKSFPDVKSGVAYSLENFTWNHTETVEIARGTDKLPYPLNAMSLNVGYAGDGDHTDHKFIGTLSVDLLKLGDYVKFPILDKVIIQPFAWFGVGRINLKDMGNSETDCGVGAYVLQVHF